MVSQQFLIYIVFNISCFFYKHLSQLRSHKPHPFHSWNMAIETTAVVLVISLYWSMQWILTTLKMCSVSLKMSFLYLYFLIYLVICSCKFPSQCFSVIFILKHPLLLMVSFTLGNVVWPSGPLCLQFLGLLKAT